VKIYHAPGSEIPPGSDILRAMIDMEKKVFSRPQFDPAATGYDPTLAGWHSRPLREAALRHIHRPVRGAVLDVGCGPGVLLATLAGENPDLRLAGIDLVPEMIRAAKDRLGPRADIRLGDANQLPWEDGRFDVVTCIDSFQHYLQPRAALAEIHRVLKSGGLLVIAGPWAPPVARQWLNLLRVVRSKSEAVIYGKREMLWMLRMEEFAQVAWFKEGSFGFVATAMTPNVLPDMMRLETRF